MKLIRLVCFTIVIAVVLSKTNVVLSYKMPYGIPQFAAFYEQEKGSIDVLFVGTSHVYSDINPAYVYDEKGIRSFDLATGGAGIWNSYFAICQALEYQKPKVVALELYGALADEEYRIEREIMDANSGLKNVLLKCKSLQVSAPFGTRLEYFLEFPRYHARYKEVSKWDFPTQDNVKMLDRAHPVYLYAENPVDYKGAVTLGSTYPIEKLEDVSEVILDDAISEKNEGYLKKIIEVTDQAGIELCFVISPMPGNENTQRKYNYIKTTLAKVNNIEIIDANLAINEIGIIPESDFGDAGHLNYKGMEKYSRWLADRMCGMFGLSDMKNAEESVSWEHNLLWEKEVSKVFDLGETTDFKTYVGKLESSNLIACISFAGSEWDYPNYFGDYEIKNVEEKDIGSFVWYGDIVDIQKKGESWVKELGDDTLAVQPKDIGGIEENVIIHNMMEQRKVQQGINIVVYDKYIGEVVDVIGFDANNSMNAVR